MDMLYLMLTMKNQVAEDVTMYAIVMNGVWKTAAEVMRGADIGELKRMVIEMFSQNIFEYMREYRRIQKEIAHGERVTPKQYGMALKKRRKKK